MLFSSPHAWRLSSVKEVKAVGEYKVEFRLKNPNPLLEQRLANEYTAILPPEATEKYGEKFGMDTLIGTGPFKFESWKRGQGPGRRHRVC